MTRRYPAAPLLLLAAAITVSGCAPDTGHIHHIPGSDVPFGLMSVSGRGAASQAPQGPTIQVYLLRAGRLVPVTRRVVVGANVPADAIRSLLDGPTDRDTAKRITTAIPQETHLLSLDLSGDIATVDLSSEFGALGGDSQTEAVAQIVYTITASPYIDAVRFAINGDSIEVPDGTGSLTATPKQRSDYPDLKHR